MMHLGRRAFIATLAASTALLGAPYRGVAAASAPALEALPDWSGTVLELWKYDNPFVPSEWAEDKLGGYDWKAANVRLVDGALELIVSEKASAQVQGGNHSASGKARWELDVSLPTLRPGVIAAPLWVFNDAAHEEIDFEFVGTKGLQITVWASVDDKHTTVWVQQIIPGDLSGKRYRLGIDYEAGKRIAFLIDGKEAAVVTPNDTDGGAFPNQPLKPYFDFWVGAGAVMDPRWAGQWEPMQPSETMIMTLHGYRQS